MNNQLFLTTAQFLEEFKRRDDEITHRPDIARPFCWILGSGASVTSGLPMGRVLAERWLKELLIQEKPEASEDADAIKAWAKSRFDYLEDFDLNNAADFFPYIYRERFQKDPHEGRRIIDGYLEQFSMNFGYKVLSYLMTERRHRIAVSTYFDNFIFEAIAIYRRKIPRLCGYETVMNYVNPASCREPLIAKPQRDLAVLPYLSPNKIATIPEEWERPLAHVFQHYTPIVIGYGDGGYSGGALMSFLKKLFENDTITAPNKATGIYWCYREDAAYNNVKPSPQVQEVVAKLGGHLVPIVGFDELMLELWEILNLSMTHIADEMARDSDRLVKEYVFEFTRVARRTERMVGNSPTVMTAKNAASRALKSWFEDESKSAYGAAD